MKKICAILFAALFASQAWAQTTFTVDGLKYTVIDEQNGYVSVAKGSREPSGVFKIETKVVYRNRRYLVTSIPDNAFVGCTGITSVIVPNTVTSIGEGAFSGCSGLTSISLPFIGCQPCYQLFDLSAPYDINQYLFCRIFGTTSYYGGTEVKTFDANFSSFFIPTSLKEVTITGDSYIPCGSFLNCITITSIIIGNNVPVIDADPFCGCRNLTSLTIGSSVTTIKGGFLYEGGWFESCNNLTHINVNTENAVYSSKDGVLFNKDQTTLICCPNGKTEYTIPNTVTSIGSDAFGYECGLTSLTIPESVTDIDDNAFLIYNTDDFVDGNILNVVLRLTSITINSDADFSNANLCFSKDGIFYRVLNKSSVEVRSKMDGLTNYYIGEISIPNKVIAGNEFDVIKIGDNAFVDSRGLKSISIPNSVTSIGQGAFSGCSSLQSITLPFVGDRVHTLDDSYQYPFGYIFGESSYEGGTATTQRYYGSSTSSSTSTTYYIPTTLKEVIINGSNYIPYGAFFNCSALTSVTTGNSVTSIDYYAFDGCSALTSVTIGNSVTSIGGCAFQKCSGLTSVTIPNSVTSIGLYAFRQCSGMTSVTIGNSVTSIGQGAFSECYDLLSVTIPNSAETIGDKAFSGCFDLVSLIFDEGSQLSSIGEDAFDSSGLTWVTIPNSVTSIGNRAFVGCYRLTEINVESGNAAYTSENGVLFNKEKTSLICYPEGKTETEYSIPSSVTNISDYALYGSSLTSVTIPNSVTSIGNYAFYGCIGLTSVTIPNSVTSIGNSAFSDCSGLTTITIPNSVTSIGTDAFSDCSGLTSVTIGNSVISIGDYAFEYCNSLTSVTIPNSVTSIGYGAFSDCDGLTSICYEGSSEPTYQTSSFDNVDKTIPVCVPADYASNSWCGFTNLIKGHDIVTDNAVAATCTESGLTEGSHCSKCGKILVAQEEVAALGHTADSIEFENTIAATCTTAGSKDSVVYCSVCQVELSREEKEIAPLGHTPNSVEFENIVPATCTAAGSKDSVVFCSVCQVELSREERAIPALGHTEVIDAAIAATCTAAGKTEGKHCSVCDAVLVAQEEVAALGHEFEKYIYNKDATTTADGTETATCERGCGATDTRVAKGTRLLEPEKGTAVSEVASTLNIYAHGNTIVVENATGEIRVYNAMGALVCSNATPCVRTEIPVTTPGIYIVKVGGTAKRVMVN